MIANRWNDVHVAGHSACVDVVKVEIFSQDNCKKPLLTPLLLIISGKRRKEITALAAYKSYKRRFDIEHFFRFMKQKLLFRTYQTPDLDHQISWWWFCCMAYWLLYHVRHVSQGPTRPWHKKEARGSPPGPGEVKRLFATKIFPVLGSPSRPPINQKKSRGRKKGAVLLKRARKSSQKAQKTSPSGLKGPVFYLFIDKIIGKSPMKASPLPSKVQNNRKPLRISMLTCFSRSPVLLI